MYCSPCFSTRAIFFQAPLTNFDHILDRDLFDVLWGPCMRFSIQCDDLWQSFLELFHHQVTRINGSLPVEISAIGLVLGIHKEKVPGVLLGLV